MWATTSPVADEATRTCMDGRRAQVRLYVAEQLYLTFALVGAQLTSSEEAAASAEAVLTETAWDGSTEAAHAQCASLAALLGLPPAQTPR